LTNIATMLTCHWDVDVGVELEMAMDFGAGLNWNGVDGIFLASKEVFTSALHHP
jgi:hypothetical protein